MTLGRLWRADRAPGARPGGRRGGLCRPDRCRRRAIRPHADRVHPGTGPGIPHHRAAASAGRQPGADRADREAGDRHHPENAGRRACRAVRRPGRDDVHGRVQFGDDLLRPAVAVQPFHSGDHGELGAGRSAQAALGDPGRLCADDPAAAGAGHRQFRRLQDDAGGSRGSRHPGAGQRHERAGGGGQQGPELRRRVHAAECRVAVGVCRYRPAEGREGRADADRRVRHAAGLSRLAIRQRLQFPRPNLRGDRPGRQPVPARPAGPDGPEGAQRQRRDGADRVGCPPAGDDDPVPRAALQPVSRRPRCRAWRHRAWRPARRCSTWRRWRPRCCRRASATSGPRSPSSRSRRGRRRCWCSAPPRCSSSWCWRRTTRAGSCRFRWC